MSVKYIVSVAIQYTVEVDVPDSEIAKGPTSAAAYACKCGEEMYWDDNTCTYADETIKIVHVSAYPVPEEAKP
jgi:hypothetical protein